MPDLVKIRQYTLAVNTGFAPCCFRHSRRGYISTELLTLANCMADMRRVAEIGEWVAGITPSRMTNRLAFLMRVDGEYTRADYWHIFQGSRLDCIYRPNLDSPSGFDQLPNPWHGRTEKAKDLKCNRILWSQTFFWFAQSYDLRNKTPTGLAVPARYRDVAVSRRSMYGTFCKLPAEFVEWVARQPRVNTFAVIGEFDRQTDADGQSESGRDLRDQTQCMPNSAHMALNTSRNQNTKCDLG